MQVPATSVRAALKQPCSEWGTQPDFDGLHPTGQRGEDPSAEASRPFANWQWAVSPRRMSRVRCGWVALSLLPACLSVCLPDFLPRICRQGLPLALGCSCPPRLAVGLLDRPLVEGTNSSLLPVPFWRSGGGSLLPFCSQASCFCPESAARVAPKAQQATAASRPAPVPQFIHIHHVLSLLPAREGRSYFVW